MTKLHTHLKKGFISILSLTLIFSNISVYAIDLDNSNIIVEEENLNEDTILIQDEENNIEDNSIIEENNNEQSNFNQNDIVNNSNILDDYNINQEDVSSLMSNDNNDENNIATTSLDEENIAIQSNDATIIDVTGLASGSETSHDCSKYLTTKYNTSQHWQECSICGKVYGSKTNHSYTEYWTMGNSCSSHNKLVHSCSCGYSYKTDNTRSHTPYSSLSSNALYHIRTCQVCHEEIGEFGYHVDSNGNRISCNVGGVCAICGLSLGKFHETRVDNHDGNLSDGTCTRCKTQFVDISGSSSSASWNGTTFTVTVKVHIPYANSTVVTNNAGFQVSQYGNITSSNSSYYERSGVKLAVRSQQMP